MSSRVAVVFDFDDTLAEDSTAALINVFAPPQTGEDSEKKAAQVFYDEAADLVTTGWDPPLAYLTLLCDKVRRGELPPITQKDLEMVGQQHVVIYPGVQDCLRELRERFQADDEIRRARLTLDFFIVSSGIGDVIRATPIARDGFFSEIWACELDYNENGIVSRPKSIISFTEKTRYLFLINKGISRDESYESPYAVNSEMPEINREVPFSHMFYVGDGPSDIPCISLIHKLGGKDNTLIVIWRENGSQGVGDRGGPRPHFTEGLPKVGEEQYHRRSFEGWTEGSKRDHRKTSGDSIEGCGLWCEAKKEKRSLMRRYVSETLPAS